MGNMWRYAVAGNIKKTHIDEHGILRYGTSAFRGNAKVYLYGRLWKERFPDGHPPEIAVLGRSRGGHFYVASVPIPLLENLRIARVYAPRALEIMDNFEFARGWWGNTQEERDDAAAFLHWLKETYGVS